MCTRLSAALMIAALGLASSTGLAQYCPPIIPQLPTVPQQPPLLQPYQPSLTPALPVRPAPAPRPVIIQPARPAVAVTGDDGGCTPPPRKGHLPPPPACA